VPTLSHRLHRINSFLRIWVPRSIRPVALFTDVTITEAIQQYALWRNLATTLIKDERFPDRSPK
jgi:hypothetical protein